jgi:hypothetical protein
MVAGDCNALKIPRIPFRFEIPNFTSAGVNHALKACALSDAKRDHGTTFMDEVERAGGSKVYYPPPDLPPGVTQKDKKP